MKIRIAEEITLQVDDLAVIEKATKWVIDIRRTNSDEKASQLLDTILFILLLRKAELSQPGTLDSLILDLKKVQTAPEETAS